MGDYNGYPNRATWNVSLWLNNDEGLYRELQRMVRRALDVDRLAEAMEEFAGEVWPDGRTPDGDKLSECDWEYLAQSEWDETHEAEESEIGQ